MPSHRGWARRACNGVSSLRKTAALATALRRVGNSSMRRLRIDKLQWKREATYDEGTGSELRGDDARRETVMVRGLRATPSRTGVANCQWWHGGGWHRSSASKRVPSREAARC
eukprot:6199176-Pleurochrysis_carterae.AAC.2